MITYWIQSHYWFLKVELIEGKKVCHAAQAICTKMTSLHLIFIVTAVTSFVYILHVRCNRFNLMKLLRIWCLVKKYFFFLSVCCNSKQLREIHQASASNYASHLSSTQRWRNFETKQRTCWIPNDTSNLQTMARWENISMIWQADFIIRWKKYWFKLILCLQICYWTTDVSY